MRAVITRWMSLMLVASGCAGTVMPQYREARTAALASPPPPPPNWKPDAVLHLSPEAIDEIVEALLDQLGPLKGSLDAGVARLEPRLTLKRLTLRRAKGCDDCVSVDLSLDGRVNVVTPLGSAKSPVDAQLAFDAVFEVEADERGLWQVLLVPRRVRDLDVSMGGTRVATAGGTIQRWIERSLFQDMPPQRIATLGSVDLPLRAVRVATAGRTIQLHLLTASPAAHPIPVERRKPARWQLDIHPDSLVAMAAAESYRAGAVAKDVVPVPTSLELDEHGGFRMGLRLWRIKGKGWWRDYEVEGTATIDGDDVDLTPSGVTEQGKSKGAVFVDPLAALGEGVILKTIERALETSLPANHREKVEGLKTVIGLEQLTGNAEGVHLSGSLVVR